MQAFYDVIEWFQPSFVLMENVLDIFKKQDGMYAKFAAARLLNMRYQTRLGCIAACDHGAPQGRWRWVHILLLQLAPVVWHSARLCPTKKMPCNIMEMLA